MSIDPMPGTHHHSLQSKRVSGTSGDGDSPETSTPYSRTPALRASHKMAERKRRTEMKGLFDQLRQQIPSHHGSKSSKWEILSKGMRKAYDAGICFQIVMLIKRSFRLHQGIGDRKA